MFAYLCIICVKTIINFLEYSTILLSVLVGYLGYLLWTFEQIGLTSWLLKQNSFEDRGFTVLPCPLTPRVASSAFNPIHGNRVKTQCAFLGHPRHAPLNPFYFASISHNGGASLVAQLVKNLLAMQETPVQFLGQEYPLEKGYATHSSILGLPLWLSW